MAGSIEARLKDKGITLPNVAAPAANYVPSVISFHEIRHIACGLDRRFPL